MKEKSKEITSQEKIRKELIDVYEELRSKFNEYTENRDLYQLAVLFKEEKILLEKMNFEDDWKTYFYEFGLIYKIRDIIVKRLLEKKELSTNRENIKTYFYNFDFKKYVEIDKNKKIDLFFDCNETFFSIVRCLIFAHPFCSHPISSKDFTYVIEDIIDSSEEHFMGNKWLALTDENVIARKNHLKFTIQRYEKSEKNLWENYCNDNFSISISNLFFIEYILHLKQTLYFILKKYKTDFQIEQETKEECYKNLISNINIKEKIAKIKIFLCKYYKIDIEVGAIPFSVKYLKYLLKSNNEKIMNWIVQQCIQHYKDKNDFYWDTLLFDKTIGDYKYSEYWFSYVNLEEEINWKQIIKSAKKYSSNIENETFIYYFINYLADVVDFLRTKTYGELYSKILEEEMRLENCASKNDALI